MLGNSPRTRTAFRVERAKSYAFGMRFLDKLAKPVSVNGATIKLTVRQPKRKGGAIVITADAEYVEAALGLVQFRLQAADTDLAPGEYVFGIVLTSSIGYSTTVVKGTWTVEDNPDLNDLNNYPDINPATNLAVYLSEGDLIEVKIDNVDGLHVVLSTLMLDFETATDTQLATIASLADDAAESETAAGAHAAAALSHAETAAGNAVTAYNHRAYAADSATAAAQSAVNAAQSAGEAEQQKLIALQAQNETLGYLPIASGYATAAGNHASTAVQARNEAIEARDAAEGHVQTAATNADSAAANAVAAYGHAVDAAESAAAAANSFPVRSSVTENFGLMLEGTEYTTQRPMPGGGSAWRLRRVGTGQPIRLRVYGDEVKQLLDQERAIGVLPTGDHGLQLEVVFGDDMVSLELTPQVDAYNLAGDSLLYITVTNTAGEALSDFHYTLDFIRTE